MGDTKTARKPHIISWDVCRMPKNHGGLGIKPTQSRNDSFMFKIIWNLHANLNDLWCQWLINKYGRNQNLLETMIVKSNDSHLEIGRCCLIERDLTII